MLAKTWQDADRALSNAFSCNIGLEDHTPENIAQEIEYAVDYDTDFHQFMLHAGAGTPLYQQMSEEGRLLNDVDPADIHGQFKFNFKHAAISRDASPTSP